MKVGLFILKQIQIFLLRAASITSDVTRFVNGDLLEIASRPLGDRNDQCAVKF